MNDIDTLLVGFILVQALVVAVVFGVALWWYTRNSGRERRSPRLVIRLGLVILVVWGLANALGDLLASDTEPGSIVVLVATCLGILLVAAVAGRLVREQPDRERLIIPLTMLLAGGITLVGSVLYFGPKLEADVDDEGPVLPAGRIEVPVPGFAVTFPEDWQVREPTAEWEETWGPSNEAWRTTLYGRPPGATEPVLCALVDASAGRGTLDSPAFMRDWAAAIEAAVGDRPDVVDHEVSTVTLPVGRVVRSDITRDDGYQGTFYNFVDDTRHVYLDCRSDEPPNDRWLSIAETIEFLPAEE